LLRAMSEGRRDGRARVAERAAPCPARSADVPRPYSPFSLPSEAPYRSFFRGGSESAIGYFRGRPRRRWPGGVSAMGAMPRRSRCSSKGEGLGVEMMGRDWWRILARSQAQGDGGCEMAHGGPASDRSGQLWEERRPAGRWRQRRLATEGNSSGCGGGLESRSVDVEGAKTTWKHSWNGAHGRAAR
jgi:hypothetical protein